MIWEWDSRMQNIHNVKVLKAAIPFFDVPLGERIDLEGLFSAIRPLTGGRERHILDMLLHFFQMKHMMEMMELVQTMQQAQEMAGEGGEESFDMMDFIKTMVSPEQQEMVDTVMSMVSAMNETSSPSEESPSKGKEEGNGVVDF